MKTIKLSMFVEYCRGNISSGGYLSEGNCRFSFSYNGTIEDYVNQYRKARKEMVNEIDSSKPSQENIFLSFSVIKTFEEEIS
jgi:hypothetical protein